MKLSLVIVLYLEQQCLHSFGRQSGPPRSYDGSACWEQILNQITKFQIKSKSNHTFSKSNPCSSNQIIMCDSIMI